MKNLMPSTSTLICCLQPDHSHCRPTPLFRAALYTLHYSIFSHFPPQHSRLSSFWQLQAVLWDPSVSSDFPKLLPTRTHKCARCCRGSRSCVLCRWLLKLCQRQAVPLLLSVKPCSWQGKLPAQNLTAAGSWASTEFHSGESENWILHLLKGHFSEKKKKSMLCIECSCFLYKLVVI